MKRTNESGRSMVEMLGVLAIIGVLSIGGIAGYTMAMNRYRANEVIDSVNKYAVIAYTACQTALTMRSGATCNVTTDGVVGAGVNTGAGVDYPTYANSGLIPVGDLGGGGVTAIGNAAFRVADGISYTDVEITFGNADICRAAASTAGTICGEDNKFVYTVRNS